MTHSRDGDSEPVHKPRDTPEKADHRRRGVRATWMGVVLPPTLLLAQIQVNYALVPWACANGHVWVVHLVSLACLAGTLAGTAVCWSSWTALGRGGSEVDAGTLAPARFVTLGALVFSAGIALVIVAVDVPGFVLGPCD
jgi:hypothetical protein